MSLSSLYFVLLFFPLFMAVYWFMPSIRRQNQCLLVFSLIFYAFGGLGYLVLLLALTGVGYLAGRLLSLVGRKRRKGILVGAVAILLAVLAVFKYAHAVTGALLALLKPGVPAPTVALPLGISFYTFKLLSYVADVYRGDIPAETRYANLLLYTVNFHQALQGPIVRYGQMRQDMQRRRFSYAGLSNGLYRFVLGLAKKTILADQIGAVANTLLPISAGVGSATTAAAWLGSACYTMQLYLDFSAYTDMALGLGQMLGFHYPENFNYPYMAVSVRDFWKRWHITLSRFFRDYVYIPLGGSRQGTRRTLLNLLAVWVLTGMWHGSSWNFVLWGLYYFCWIALEHTLRDRGVRALPRPLGHVYAMLVFNFGWVLFRFSDMKQLGGVIAALCGRSGNGFVRATDLLQIKNNIFLLMYCVLACTPFFVWAGKQLGTLAAQRGKNAQAAQVAWQTALGVLLLTASLLAMAGGSFTPFLYNQF